MDTLPNEILYNILRQLPQKDLLKCTTVCKLFNEIITSYKLINALVIAEDCDYSALPVPNRKYSKVIIRDNNEASILKALQAIGDNVLEVKFELHTSTLSSITKALNHLPKVQQVTFYYIRIEDDEIVNEIVQPVPQNIDLKLHESSPQIFKVLGNLKLNSLEIFLYGDSCYSDFTDILPLMEKQKELKSFSLSGIYESNLLYGIVPTGNYHLKEFSLSNSDLEEWTYLETYLSDHAGSLESLKFKSLQFNPSNIIKSCTNLKVLDITEVAAIELEDEMETVEELSIKEPNQVLAKFPNIKKLYIENASVETNQLIHGSKVIDLSVRYGSVEGISCENAKKLTLTNIDGALTENFFKMHSKVEDFKLENHFLLDDALLELIVSNLKNLKVLTIYGLNNLTGGAFQIIKKHCKHLRVLDTKTWTQRYSIEDWKCLFKSNNGIEIYIENFNF